MKRNQASSELYLAQIDCVHRQVFMALTVNMVNSAFVAVLMSSYLGQTQWLIFLVLNIVLTVARAVGGHFYNSAKSARSVTRWAIFATVGSGLSGLLWGAGSLFLLPDNVVEQTFVAFVIGGMCVASLVSFSYYIPVFAAYVFPATLPLAARFFIDGWPVHGDMMVVFAVAITVAAYSSSRGFATGMQLNFELMERTRQLTAANSRLEAETEQRRIVEDRLRQAQKMEALGQLTGGIAHDFNNLLTAIIGHIEMAQARIDDDPRLSGLLQVALRAADRGATLTGHLLAFARRQRLDPKAVDVAAAIRGVKDVLRQTIGPEIRIVARTKHDLAAAWADPDQLEMAILNLALNARDAMQAGGKLLIVAENRRAPVSGSPPDLTPGDYVVVSVSDTGIGMEAETLTRAFEPFFTTKEAGRGSGLGLSIVHGFAAQSGGSVQISSSLGRGTKVDLWVPCSNELAVARAAPDQRRSITGPRHGRILVCDDDADVRSVVAEVLRDSGYSVWEAETPRRALEVLGKEKAIDLFVVDYAMPEMNGLALIELARTSQYSLKVLLVSGHAEILKTGEIPGIPLLAKPFKTADLIRRIAELLHPSEVGVERSDRSLMVVPS